MYLSFVYMVSVTSHSPAVEKSCLWVGLYIGPLSTAELDQCSQCSTALVLKLGFKCIF